VEFEIRGGDLLGERGVFGQEEKQEVTEIKGRSRRGKRPQTVAVGEYNKKKRYLNDSKDRRPSEGTGWGGTGKMKGFQQRLVKGWEGREGGGSGGFWGGKVGRLVGEGKT